MDIFKKLTSKKFGWSPVEISKTKMRNKWKKYYKKSAKQSLKYNIDKFKQEYDCEWSKNDLAEAEFMPDLMGGSDFDFSEYKPFEIKRKV
jgi:hypothetical protein